ncbi:MAG: STAS domain-containing protein [Ignavibacteriales bacterium]|nr:STAS domain-containing protein [Ignavibacteriales bacterium]
MKFDVSKNGTSAVLTIKERKLDVSISPELKGEFILLCRPQVKSLIVDLTEVEFCDSSGLSALLIAERQMRQHGGQVKLVGVHKKVLSLLKISQLDKVFQLFDSVAKAQKN